MAKKFLSNIGKSADIRQLISHTDVDQTTVTLVLDELRTLKVKMKTNRQDELTVRCSDTDKRATVILHLPYQGDAAASADIIDHTDNTESTST